MIQNSRKGETMARKFKIGDKVRIVKDVSIAGCDKHGLRLGRIGVVASITMSGNDYPYGVQLRCRSGTDWFNAKELELAKRGK